MTDVAGGIIYLFVAIGAGGLVYYIIEIIINLMFLSSLRRRRKERLHSRH
jgi:hypothetical protein